MMPKCNNNKDKTILCKIKHSKATIRILNNMMLIKVVTNLHQCNQNNTQFKTVRMLKPTHKIQTLILKMDVKKMRF